jgi:hypothetical protein
MWHRCAPNLPPPFLQNSRSYDHCRGRFLIFFLLHIIDSEMRYFLDELLIWCGGRSDLRHFALNNGRGCRGASVCRSEFAPAPPQASPSTLILVANCMYVQQVCPYNTYILGPELPIVCMDPSSSLAGRLFVRLASTAGVFPPVTQRTVVLHATSVHFHLISPSFFFFFFKKVYCRLCHGNAPGATCA